MNRDALLATLIGFAIGITITAIILVGPGLIKKAPTFSLTKLPSIGLSLPKFSMPKFASKGQQGVEPQKTESKVFAFSVDSPLADAIESQPSILVSGTAQPGSVVIVQGMTDDAVVTASDEGKYAAKVALTEGKNDIAVTGYGKDAKADVQTVTVFYTPEEL